MALDAPCSPPPSAADNARPRRENMRLPERYRNNAAHPWQPRTRRHVDTLPEPLIPISSDPSSDLVPSHPTVSSHVGGIVESQAASQPQHIVDLTPARTKRKVFGLFREYCRESFPKHDPEAAIDRELLLDPINQPSADSYLEVLPTSNPCSSSNAHSSPSPAIPPELCSHHTAAVALVSTRSSADSNVASFHPYPNWTSFRLRQWYWTGSPKKSESTFKELIEILTDRRFCAEDIVGINWKSINEKLLKGETHSSTSDSLDTLPDDWYETDVQISMPVHSKGDEPGIHVYEAVTLCHRKLVSMIRSKVTDRSVFPHLHLEPYKLFWKPNSAEPVRVHREVYTSPAFIEAHDTLQRSPPEPDCTRERVVIALMFSSDGTHLTDYGDAKLHPLYVEFGNESKERRSKQSNGCFEHVAYFESVSSSLVVIVAR